MLSKFVPVHCHFCGVEVGGGIIANIHDAVDLSVCKKCGKPVCFSCTANKLSRLFFRKPVCKECGEGILEEKTGISE